MKLFEIDSHFYVYGKILCIVLVIETKYFSSFQFNKILIISQEMKKRKVKFMGQENLELHKKIVRAITILK